MSFNISVAGKGGTGKTTVTALLIRNLKKKGKTPILAVDADASSNLAESIGFEVKNTVGSTIAEFFDKKLKLPSGMPKGAYLELKLNEILIEGKNVDLLVMGRGEGPGCYCFPNTILRKYMDMLSKNYRYIITDNEAGMEHLSRKTTQDVNILLILSDNSISGIRTVGKIKALSEELGLRIENKFLIVDNRANDGLRPEVKNEIDKIEIPLLGVIPYDNLIYEYELQQKPITEIPDSSPAVKCVDELIEKAGII